MHGVGKKAFSKWFFEQSLSTSLYPQRASLSLAKPTGRLSANTFYTVFFCSCHLVALQ